ncbi:FAD-dependent oxidoreductase [Betaproteobacteria bacterium GR16-43]|nr:FAD-dependent oxidoreductase [Betaproteobacteria bacterium GR16-43]
MNPYDCTIVGASFAGLACATTLAHAGHRVLVLERKAEAGEKLHTTGLLVKEAVESSALLADLPPVLVRRLEGVRLYAPDLRAVDLDAPGYYFLATDTGALLRWMAGRAEEAGAEIRWRTPFETAGKLAAGFTLGRIGSTRYLVGADGPTSRVARALRLGVNREFLFGIEHEYDVRGIPDANRLHCFLDRRIAPGYLGWVVAGVGTVQVGIARRERGGAAREAKAALALFLDKIAPVFDFRSSPPTSVRAGLIPCGGVVRKAFAERVLLVGDAAGTVSPLTAGGIHTALRHGAAAGVAIDAFLGGRSADPGSRIASAYPRFRAKRLLRWAFDRFQHDGLANALLGTRVVREAASRIYFHRGARR